MKGGILASLSGQADDSCRLETALSVAYGLAMFVAAALGLAWVAHASLPSTPSTVVRVVLTAAAGATILHHTLMALTALTLKTHRKAKRHS